MAPSEGSLKRKTASKLYRGVNGLRRKAEHGEGAEEKSTGLCRSNRYCTVHKAKAEGAV